MIDNAINMEVKKDGLRQTQDGIWKLTLTVHPNDMSVELMQAPMGTRYGMAIVPIEDDALLSNQIYNKPPVVGSSNIQQTEGEKLRIRAVLLSKDLDFQQFLSTYMESKFGYPSESECAWYIKEWCIIKSRSELAHNIEAQAKFKELLAKFDAWKMERQYSDNLSKY